MISRTAGLLEWLANFDLEFYQVVLIRSLKSLKQSLFRPSDCDDKEFVRNHYQRLIILNSEFLRLQQHYLGLLE
jgi:hypothetical protein